jgi:glutathione peroxidase-family protein
LKSNSKEFNIDGKLKNIGWNFGKFLLNGKGNLIGYFRPTIEPEGIIGDIEKLI